MKTIAELFDEKIIRDVNKYAQYDTGNPRDDQEFAYQNGAQSVKDILIEMDTYLLRLESAWAKEPIYSALAHEAREKLKKWLEG